MQKSAGFYLSSQDSQNWVGNMLGMQFPGVASCFFSTFCSQDTEELKSQEVTWGFEGFCKKHSFIYIYIHIDLSPSLLISASYFEIACFIIP